MNITIIGGRGRIGSVLARMLSERGHSLVSLDIGDRIDLDEIITNSDLVFLAVPVKEALGYLERAGDTNKLVELSSVKAPFRKFSGKIMSIHPLFGPKSLANGSGKQIIFVEDISRKGSIGRIRSLFEGCDVISLTSEEHDRAMGALLVTPYLLARLSESVLPAMDVLATNSYRKASEFYHLLDDENPGVVRDTISFNPFSDSVIAGMKKALGQVQEDLS